MARRTTARRRRGRRAARPARPAVHGERLPQRLALLRWLHAQFGFPTPPGDVNGDAATRKVLETCCGRQEGFEPSTGVSHVTWHLLGQTGRQVSDTDLKRYDENIRRHLFAINERRAEPITLRYFQHLALLYTEHFLDRLFAGRRTLCAELNEFVRTENRRPGLRAMPPFTPEGLRKLAFMMATGSGKTLLMHINYRQFLHYNAGRPLANILLVTPGRDLSAQHEREMLESGVPCRRFEPGRPRLLIDDPHTVEIIEITRFVEEKKDRGTRVEPGQFSGRNLVFIDEGHRSRSEEGVQRQLREALIGEEGFGFEYSATFQQAFAGDDDQARKLRDEYGGAITFDYSYRWFLSDGFGKDFTVLNSRSTDAQAGEWSLLAGLFVFAAQAHAHRENKPALEEYNIAPPLALMVGRQIAGSSQEDRATRSDVLRTLLFFQRVLRNEDGWTVARLDDLLRSHSPIDVQGIGGALQDAREYLNGVGFTDAAALFDFITERVLHSPGGGGLVVHRIRGNENEIALRGSQARGDELFGLVYIGKASDLTALIEPEHGIVQSEDALTDTWFPRIDDPGSPVNFLIGAKKFIEGWSSWRVSAMGLVNVGRGEGSEIIQLFGRGVRLLGLHRGLKRSSYVQPPPPPTLEPCLKVLERLFIFAVNARYMEQFREIMDREGVDGSGFLEFQLALWRRMDHEDLPNLRIPQWPGEAEFRATRAVAFDSSHLGDSPSRRRFVVRRLTWFEAVATNADDAAARGGPSEKRISLCSWRHLIDHESLYLRLAAYARERGFDNLALTSGAVKRLLEEHADLYVQAPAEFHALKGWDDRRRVEEAVFDLLKSALDRIYRCAQGNWESRHATLPVLAGDHANLKFSYRVRVPQSMVTTAETFVRELQTLTNSCPKENWDGTEAMSAVVRFGDHLYQPLLIDTDLDENGERPFAAEQTRLEVSPPRLTKSEQHFVDMLRDYWAANRETAHAGERIFLLRNLSRGKGVGFFESQGFYPDFILWHLLPDSRQRLVFIEPHGMRQEEAPDKSAKVRIAREIEQHLQAAIAASGQPITATAFIISDTKFETLTRMHADGWTVERYAASHILFPATIRNQPGLGGILSAVPAEGIEA